MKLGWDVIRCCEQAYGKWQKKPGSTSQALRGTDSWASGRWESEEEALSRWGETEKFCQSVYPAMLGQGFPKRHALVVYLLLRDPRPAAEMDALLRLRSLHPASYCPPRPRPLIPPVIVDADEVDLAVWLSRSQAQAVVDGAESSSEEIP